jgi:hypothetical protein
LTQERTYRASALSLRSRLAIAKRSDAIAEYVDCRKAFNSKKEPTVLQLCHCKAAWQAERSDVVKVLAPVLLRAEVGHTVGVYE